MLGNIHSFFSMGDITQYFHRSLVVSFPFVHIPRIGKTRLVLAFIFCLSSFLPIGQAQIPCHDTIVHAFDSICEGSEYDFNGRTINYTGIFFDTVPRVTPNCDSIIILHLEVMDHPVCRFSAKPLCSTGEGYRLMVSDDPRYNLYCRWSSHPDDPLLRGHENDLSVIVSPVEPTSYSVYIDYDETPMCPDSGSSVIYPLEPVVAAMYVALDHIDLSHLEFSCEDFSVGTREPRYGWAGRNWYLNGILQPQKNEFVTFEAKPWWPDTVVIMMEGYSNTCIDTAYKVLPFHHVSVLFPNAFTPEADNNNRFVPALQGLIDYEIWIFDRRGMQVFHSTDTSQHWDGTTMGGIPCPQGVYTYRCRYRPLHTPGGFLSDVGSVTLIR